MGKRVKTVSADSVVRQIAPDEEVTDLRRQVSELRRRLDEYKAATGSLKTFFHDLREYVRALPPPDKAALYPGRQRKGRVGRPVTAALHLTDWHTGKVQPADEIEGYGEYSPDIQAARLVQLQLSYLRWIEVQRSGYEIPDMAVLVTGDLISGDIHRDLVATNAYPPPVQVVEAGRMLAGLIAGLSAHFERVVVHFVVADNHGRLTPRPQAREEGLNSLNYLVGHVAKLMVERLPAVDFRLYPTYQQTVEVRGRRYLMMHGHQIRGWAGFPFYGVERKASREAIRRMREGRGRFDRMILGHFHAPLRHPYYWIGGSLSGTDALDHKEGRMSYPSQTGWLVHEEHGEFNEVDFVTDAGHDGRSGRPVGRVTEDRG